MPLPRNIRRHRLGAGWCFLQHHVHIARAVASPGSVLSASADAHTPAGFLE
jgi:hypothetical protein